MALPFPNSHGPYAPEPWPFEFTSSATFIRHIRPAVLGHGCWRNYTVQLSGDNFQGLCPRVPYISVLPGFDQHRSRKSHEKPGINETLFQGNLFLRCFQLRFGPQRLKLTRAQALVWVVPSARTSRPSPPVALGTCGLRAVLWG